MCESFWIRHHLWVQSQLLGSSTFNLRITQFHTSPSEWSKMSFLLAAAGLLTSQMWTLLPMPHVASSSRSSQYSRHWIGVSCASGMTWNKERGRIERTKRLVRIERQPNQSRYPRGHIFHPPWPISSEPSPRFLYCGHSWQRQASHLSSMPIQWPWPRDPVKKTRGVILCLSWCHFMFILKCKYWDTIVNYTDMQILWNVLLIQSSMQWLAWCQISKFYI